MINMGFITTKKGKVKKTKKSIELLGHTKKTQLFFLRCRRRAKHFGEAQ